MARSQHNPGMGIDLRYESRYMEDGRFDGDDTTVTNRGMSLTKINTDVMKFLWLNIDHDFETRIQINSSYSNDTQDYILSVENKTLD